MGPSGRGGVSDTASRRHLQDAVNEAQNEAAWLRNNGSADVDITGWLLRDLSNNTWTLARVGVIAAGAEEMVLRNGESMAMPNTGDTIALVDPSGQVVHSVSYDAIGEGVEVAGT